MINESLILARITRDAEALTRAARKVILDMLRRGATLPELLDAIKTMRLPSAEIAKLDATVNAAMQEISRARIAAGEPDADVTRIMARTKLSLPEIRTDVRQALEEMVQSAIRREIGVDAFASEIRQKQIGSSQTLANTSIAGFNNLFTFEQASEIGVDRFRYSGPAGGTIIREFCAQRVGRVFTLAQIELMDNGQGLPVKAYCGGYNCRHEWLMEVGG